MRRLAFPLAFAAAVVLSARLGLAMDVTQCGQRVPKGGVGVLTGNLDCSHPGDCDGTNFDQDLLHCVGVRLEGGATLQLGGFSLTGPGPSVFRFGVFCNGPCRVIGPGTIDSFWQGIDVHKRDHLSGATLKLTGVTLTDIGSRGIEARTLIASGLTLRQAGKTGILAHKVRISESSVSECGETGISSFRVSARTVSVSDNTLDGISGSIVSLRDATVSGNGDDGVSAGRRLRARDSVITGNGINCPPEELHCVDIEGSRAFRLRLRDTTYDTCWPEGRCS